MEHRKKIQQKIASSSLCLLCLAAKGTPVKAVGQFLLTNSIRSVR